MLWRRWISTVVLMLIAHLPVRQRYVFTRRNGLRLRYLVVPVALIFVLSLSTVVGFSKDSRAFRNDDSARGALEYVASAAQQENIDSVSASASLEPSMLPEGTGRDSLMREQETLEPALVLAAATMPLPQPREERFEIAKGDALSVSLQKAGISAHDTYRIVSALDGVYDPRHIRPGQELLLRFDPLEDSESGEDDYRFSRMEMVIDPLHTLVLRHEENAFSASIEEQEVVPRLEAKQAKIELSLFGSAAKAGVPDAITAEAIRVFSWDVDFQRDIRQGDELEVLYENLETPEGKFIKTGNIVYARLNVNGHNIPVYRFESKNGDVDYYTAEGRSIRKALMKTPIDGARMSSGFGMRKHPVLGYGKMHKGLDFAAPRGTPIYAAGDAVVEKAGPWSSYGNYIRLRHNSSLKTAYAHLQRIAKGVSSGKRVKQGQVIGYVGTTGRSTGPHLHYEVIVNGAQVNPKTHKSPQGTALKGEALAAFKAQVTDVDSQFAMLVKGNKFAAR